MLAFGEFGGAAFGGTEGRTPAELSVEGYWLLGGTVKQTTEDGRISLLTARCIGACSLAPAVIVDGEARGKVAADELVAQLEAM